MRAVSARNLQKKIRKGSATFWSMIQRRRKEKTIPWAEARKRLRPAKKS